MTRNLRRAVQLGLAFALMTADPASAIFFPGVDLPEEPERRETLQEWWARIPERTNQALKQQVMGLTINADYRYGTQDIVGTLAGTGLRFDGEASSLLAYRFYLRLPPSSGLPFFRIDLNLSKGNYDPLDQPRSHLHPGFENVHLPFPVLEPLAVLDRFVHVIEPYFTR